MTYAEFEPRLLVALVDAADLDSRGRCEAFAVAETILPRVAEKWVRDAVGSLQQQGCLGNVIRPLGESSISLDISGEGRKAAERLRAQ